MNGSSPPRTLVFSLPLSALVALAGCGATTVVPPASGESKPTAIQSESAKPKNDQPSFGAEYGGMNEGAVARAFLSTFDALNECFDDGCRSMPYLSGEVSFYLEVDSSGSVVHGHVEESDLGDRDVSGCMLNVLRKKIWPSPVGGKPGKIRTSMAFSPLPDVTPPTTWDSQQVAAALEQLSEPIARCKDGITDAFTVTAYVGTLRNPDADTGREPAEVGKMMALEVIPPTKEGVAAADCLANVLRSGTYPSPGQRPAKVTFTL